MKRGDVLLLSPWTDPVRVNPAYAFIRDEIDRCSRGLAPRRLPGFFAARPAEDERYSRMLQYDVQYPFCPGLLSIAAYLEHHGLSVTCVSLDLERESAGAAEGWLDAALRRLCAETTTAVGVTAVTPEYARAISVLATVKRIAPHLKTMIGGTHVSYVDEEAARHPAVDVVVRGEGEATALELVERWRQGRAVLDVPGTTVRGTNGSAHAGEIVRNPDRQQLDLRDLPRPAYHLLPKDGRKLLKLTPTFSRGCPFECEYCVEGRFWARRVRHKDPKVFVDELEYLAEECDFRFIHIADSTFGINGPAVEALCDELEHRCLDCVFSVNVRPDVFDYMGEPLFRRLLRTRFVEFCIGVETFDESVLAPLKRQHKGDLLDTLVRMKALGVPFVKLYMMIGVPGDTHEGLQRTVNAVRRLVAEDLIYYATAKFFVPTPGTPLFERLPSSDREPEWRLYERYTYPPWYPHANLAPWELEAYLLLLQGAQLTEYKRKLGVEPTASENVRAWAAETYLARKYM
jgi:radical SAM superfamily enzyme YgiQ (UPF0313 family)